jgi:hypothetical protein
VWYRFRARRKVTVLLGTCRSNFDTVVAVYAGGEVTSLRQVDFNNDSPLDADGRITSPLSALCPKAGSRWP